MSAERKRLSPCYRECGEPREFTGALPRLGMGGPRSGSMIRCYSRAYRRKRTETALQTVPRAVELRVALVGVVKQSVHGSIGTGDVTVETRGDEQYNLWHGFPPSPCILQSHDIGSDDGGQVPSDLVHRPVPPLDRQQIVDNLIGETLLDDLGRIAPDD